MYVAESYSVLTLLPVTCYRVSAEGPVWSLVLHQLFVSLEGVTGPGREREEVIERLIR